MQNILIVENIKKQEKILNNKGISDIELTKRAVLAFYNEIPKNKRTIIFCGSGNNGGDGLYIAKKMLDDNCDVTLVLVKAKLSATGKYFLDLLKNYNLKILKLSELKNLNEYELVIDCILGSGVKGSLSKDVKDAISLINSSNSFVVSIDIPSGLNPDNGLAETAVICDKNLAIGALKPGLKLNQAKDFIKDCSVFDIGFDMASNLHYLSKQDFISYLPKRKNFSNKGTYKKACVFGGSINYSGAIKLSSMALASLKMGAGLGVVASADCLKNAMLERLLENTFIPLPSKDGVIQFDKEKIDCALFGVSSLAFGMGMTSCDETVKCLEYILNNYAINLIIDADGLNALAKIDLKILNETKCSVCLTPHVLEFSRISGLGRDEILADPINSVLEFCKKYKVVLLLKGCATLICQGEEIFIVDSGAPGMATAGSGDVLSGIIAGACAYNEVNAKNIAFCAFVNGCAGELASKEFGDYSMVASDTVRFIPNVLTALL